MRLLNVFWYAQQHVYITRCSMLSVLPRLPTLRRKHRSIVRLLVGGDLHLYADTVVCNSDSRHCVDQVITSGMTKESSTLSAWHLVAFQAINQRIATASVASAGTTYTAKYLPNGHLGNNFMVLQLPSTSTARECADATLANPVVCWWRETFDSPLAGTKLRDRRHHGDAYVCMWSQSCL